MSFSPPPPLDEDAPFDLRGVVFAFVVCAAVALVLSATAIWLADRLWGGWPS